ncbi:DNA topoisomerase family protein [Vibrio hibernica]|uniref:DNA topoisomerase family protein n=1 Tax=Vibrio hibernica TaxID=2587465 RepID=UPI00188258A0|nr:topoisomerase DNA-binding C4 zinc finger domain-containing protein [Vibrio hibernica]
MKSKIDGKLFTVHEPALEHEACPQCHETLQGELHLRHGKHGPFLGCNQYPQCDYIRPLHQHDGHIVKELGVACPECTKSSDNKRQGELVLRQGRYGMFIGCSCFPECQHIASMDQSEPSQGTQPDIACPECSSGHLVERQSRFGKSFYACNAYPKCKFSINSPPLIGCCQQCGFPLLVEKKLASGNKILCANRKCQHQQED